MSCIFFFFFFTCSLLFEAQSRIRLLHFVFHVQLSLLVCSCHQDTSFLNLWPNLATPSLFFCIHLLLMYIKKRPMEKKRQASPRYHTVDPDNRYIYNLFIWLAKCSKLYSDHCVCANGAARLKRKPRGIWFIYKAIAFMYKKPNSL